MNMKKIIFTIALACFITSNAQNITTNGTILLDDATSRTRVVVDAFLNSSNRVHELIEEVAPSSGGDFTTNNTVLVNTIETVSPKTSLEPATNYTDEVTGVLSNVLITGEMQVWSAFSALNAQHADYADNSGALSDGTSQRSGAQIFAQLDAASHITTNDVCNIVTNETVEGFTDWVVTPFMECTITWENKPGSDTTCWVVRFDGIFEIGVGYPVDAETATSVNFYAKGEERIATRTRITSNALGLARLTDIAPTVSNTVTKAYVEDLGIESGISASTATNIAQSALGEFANTGTVYNAQNADNAIDAQSSMYANSAYSLEGTDGFRTADQIFPVLDESASTNYANTAAANAVANSDTTYRRTIGITNLNQSVQYVSITDTAPNTLAISMPTDGVTKDWMVYVVSVTNVTLSLPAATWWMADTAYTNDIPPATPTALWFSQVTDGIFILGRQELTEVTAP